MSKDLMVRVLGAQIRLHSQEVLRNLYFHWAWKTQLLLCLGIYRGIVWVHPLFRCPIEQLVLRALWRPFRLGTWRRTPGDWFRHWLVFTGLACGTNKKENFTITENCIFLISC